MSNGRRPPPEALHVPFTHMGRESQDNNMLYGHFTLHFGTHCPILNCTEFKSARAWASCQGREGKCNILTGPPLAPNTPPEGVGLAFRTFLKVDFMRDYSLTQTHTDGSSNPTGKNHLISEKTGAFFFVLMGAFPSSRVETSPAAMTDLKPL